MNHSSKARFEPPPQQEGIRAGRFHRSGTFVAFTKEDLEQSIPARFEKIVRQFPNRVAIKTKNETLTYNELNQTANRLVGAIRARCGAQQEPIALLLEHGADIIAAILGVLKAGKIYVVLDANDSNRKNASILEDSQAPLVVSNDRNMSLLNDLLQPRRPMLNIDEISPNHSGENLGLSVSAGNLAYIMYTSGSTGKPKAVTQSHRNVLYNTMVSTNGLHYCAEDRFTLLHFCGNGSSINHLFGALLNGGALFRFDVRTEGVTVVPRHVAEERITIYHSIPALFRQFVAGITGSEDFSELRVLTLSGEAATKRDVELYKKYFSSNCVFVHRLGSREVATVFFHVIDKATQMPGNLVPVGTAVDGIKVTLVDEDDRQVDCNEVGEIVVRSRYLSPGYWRDPDLTQATFLPAEENGDERIYRTGDLGRLRPDGFFEKLGRKDSRVKIRGYRFEITEVETVLRDIDSIENAVVIAVDDQHGEQRLVAFIVSTEKPRPSISGLRRALSEKLPDYMIPSTFVFLDALPLMLNGKVNKRQLPDFGNSRPDLGTPFVAPGTLLEAELAKIWAEVLTLDRIGIHDNFFALGGHSLAAARIGSQVIKQFQLELPLQSLLTVPTVAKMVAIITAHQGKKLDEKEMEKILTELELLTDEEARRLLANKSEIGHRRD
jgi:amino acid adenylation domain-containing protein